MFCSGMCAEAPVLWIASTNHIHQTGTDILKSPLWSPKDLKSSLPLEKETKIQQWNWNSTNRRVKVIAMNTRIHTHTRQFMANHENELPVSLWSHVYVFIVARFLRDIQVPLKTDSSRKGPIYVIKTRFKPFYLDKSMKNLLFIVTNSFNWSHVCVNI